MRRIFILTLASVGALFAITAIPAALFGSGTAGLEAFAMKADLKKQNPTLRKHEPPPPRSGAGPRGGDPAGIAVSDPGSPPDRRSKSNK